MPAPLDFFVTAFVTLLLVVDPVGLAPTFLAVTEGFPQAARRSVGRRSSIIAAGILMGTVGVGNWLLSTLGISLAAFRIAGGLLLFSIASEMVFGVRLERQSKEAEQAIEERVRNVAAFPLAIPLMAGPGALTATVLLAGQAGRDILRIAVLGGVIVAVCAICAIVYAFAARIERSLGTTGNVLVARLLGVVLAALAVQYVVDGIRTLIAA